MKQNDEDKKYILKIKDGDEDALNRIMEKYKNFVYAKAKTFFIVGAEQEDIIQEGMIGLFKAIKGYDFNKEVTFSSFADLCIRRQIISAIKASTRQKHIPLNSYLSLNKTSFDEDTDREVIEQLDLDTVPDPLETLTKKETYRSIELKMSEVLSDFEQQVFNEYLNGESYVKIASKLNSHVKSVDNAIQRIKKKVEKHIAEEDRI
ncbi:MAG: RNA polymerase sporulation sigma factor SigH [Clostridia bacterium]|nr:RNA polymerase sporulation sigma factor SigH [Clostridia bacterium]